MAITMLPFDVDFLDLDGAEKLADMYGLAEKYQLPDFQDLVIQKVKATGLAKRGSNDFFAHSAPKFVNSHGNRMRFSGHTLHTKQQNI